jgi:hypothetical protein
MTQEDHFKVELPNYLKLWASHHADRIGLPSPENYILLIVRQAWQKEYLEALEKACEPQKVSA